MSNGPLSVIEQVSLKYLSSPFQRTLQVGMDNHGLLAIIEQDSRLAT